MSQTPELHHPLTIKVLGPGGITSGIDEFRSGVARASIPALLELCAKLRFVPVVERTIEATFSRIHMRTVFRRAGPSYISVGLRTSARNLTFA